MPVRLNSSGGGSVTLDVPATAGTFTVNLPAANGDVVVTGGGSTVQFGAGSVSAPSITFSGDTNTGIYSPAADTIAFTEGGVEAMRIDSSGRVGIGTSSPDYLLTLQTADAAISLKDSGGITRAYVGIAGVVGSAPTGALRLRSDQGGIVFVQSGTETARITANGDFCVATTAPIVGTGNTSTGFGVERAANGTSVFISRTTDTPLRVNRNNDGDLVNFNRSGTAEGAIVVSGSTVSYNGGHLARWSQLLSGQRDPALLKGTVLSNLDEMCEWLDAEGNPLPNEQLNRVKVSDVEGDPNVAGVFVNWDNDDQANPYDMNIAMTGDMIIRIGAGVVVQKGDLLMSAGDGTAKPQGDDIRRSKTVAKVTSNHVTCTYDDGSYCVPCVLMAC